LADIEFDASGKASFPTKYHGEVTLSKWKWDQICSQPERYYYRHNGEKVATTLINPGRVRYHRVVSGQFFYYKQFNSFRLNETVEGPLPCKYFAVVIDASTKRVCTVYPVLEPKDGKEYIGKKEDK